MKLKDLTVHLASSNKGALRTGLTLGAQTDCMDFFKPLFPESRLYRDYTPNLSLMKGVHAALRNGPIPDDISLDFSCTPFQWHVLRAITLIPFGKIKTYGEIASLIERPGGARAVGQALSRNPLPIIFP